MIQRAAPTRAAIAATWAFLLIHPALAAPPNEAPPAETAWSQGALSKARLVAAGGLGSAAGPAVYRTAIEIQLSGEAHTYWRLPGDAGVPPVLSTQGSSNVKSAALSYPAPERMEEAGLAVFGYKGHVLLPMSIEPADPAKPVHLAVSFSYAACLKICIPASADMSLDLAPSAPPSSHASKIAEARQGLPVRTENGGTAKLEVSPVLKGEKPGWRVRIAAPQESWRDLFVEAPEGWYFESRKAEGGFDLVAVETPKSPHYPVPVTLTLDGAKADYEVSASIPAP